MEFPGLVDPLRRVDPGAAPPAQRRQCRPATPRYVETHAARSAFAVTGPTPAIRRRSSASPAPPSPSATDLTGPGSAPGAGPAGTSDGTGTAEPAGAAGAAGAAEPAGG